MLTKVYLDEIEKRLKKVCSGPGDYNSHEDNDEFMAEAANDIKALLEEVKTRREIPHPSRKV